MNARYRLHSALRVCALVAVTLFAAAVFAAAWIGLLRLGQACASASDAQDAGAILRAQGAMIFGGFVWVGGVTVIALWLGDLWRNR